MPADVLKSAGKLFRKRKFSQVIRLLEQQIFRFRDSFQFYLLLGNSCLFSDDYGGADSYLKRAVQLESNHVNTLLGLAAVALKRTHTEEAINNWLKVLDLEPNNRAARRGLDLARKYSISGSADLSEISDSRLFRDILPPRPFNRSIIILPLLILLAGTLTLAAVYFIQPLLPGKALGRPGLPDIELSKSQPTLISMEGDYHYILTEKDILTSFKNAKKYLTAFRDNMALKELNRILYSNASAYVKEKARLLAAFVQKPDFTTVKDTFSYKEVTTESLLYNGCYTVWKGKVANLVISRENITFDLLVGYHEQKELLGIVPVSLDFGADLENGTALEVLGRIESEAGVLSIKGISIHQLLQNKK